MYMTRKMVLKACLLVGLIGLPEMAGAEVLGITGNTGTDQCGVDGAQHPVDRCFSLTALPGHITLGDGNQLLIWGFSDDSAPVTVAGADGIQRVIPQYPGPTLLMREGERVKVVLKNGLTRTVLDGAGRSATTVPAASIVFPGQTDVVAYGGSLGTLTREARDAGGIVAYTFTAGRPGTFLYQAGSQPDLAVEMGMVGTMIVRPAGLPAGTKRAYAGAGTAYDREFLYLISEMDRAVHEDVEAGRPVDPSTFNATLWFMNGRNGPDTLVGAPAMGATPQGGSPWYPAQPYHSLTHLEAGERVLARVVVAGRDLHPFHHHGNNAWVVARDAHVLESAPGAEVDYPDYQFNNVELKARGAKLPDLAVSGYTVQAVPGATFDFIWTWTGKGLGWDPYGTTLRHAADGVTVRHSCVPGASVAMPGEDLDAHCKALPVTLPENQALTLGGLWSGSPELGATGALPPGEGGLNPAGGYTFMWHSHTERELTNDNVFPGGMMTMTIVEAPGQLTAEAPGLLLQ